MKYYCVEHDECGFVDQTHDLDKHSELICPACYSPLLMYRNTEQPNWIQDPAPTKRSNERLMH